MSSCWRNVVQRYHMEQLKKEEKLIQLALRLEKAGFSAGISLENDGLFRLTVRKKK